MLQSLMTTVEESPAKGLVINLLAQFLECILYGMYLETVALWAQVIAARQKSGRPLNRSLAAVVLCMLSLGTVDIVIGVYQVIINSVYPQHGPVPVILSTLDWSCETPNVIRIICLMAQAIVGDGVLLYRCYLVWDRRWYITVFSACLWISELVCCVAAVCRWFEQPDLGLNTIDTKPFIVSTLVFMLVFNLVTTSLLVFAILRVDKEANLLLPGSQRSNLSHVSRVIVETGLVYSSCICIIFVLYCTSSIAILIAVPCTIQITGIAFNFLIIRIDGEESSRKSTDPTCSFVHPGGFIVALPESDSQPGVYNPDRSKEDLELEDTILQRPSSQSSINMSVSEGMGVGVADRCHYMPESTKVEG